jgi:hypothetical protein
MVSDDFAMVQLYEKLKTGVWGHLEKGVKLTQMS